MHRLLEREHPGLTVSLNKLATLYWTTGRHAKAELLLKRAIAIDEMAHGCDHPGLATSLDNLAGLYQATGRRDAAEPLLERAVAIDVKAHGPQHPNLASRLNNLERSLGNEPPERGRGALRAGPRDSREKFSAEAPGPGGHPRELRQSPRPACRRRGISKWPTSLRPSGIDAHPISQMRTNDARVRGTKNKCQSMASSRMTPPSASFVPFSVLSLQY